MNAVRRSFLVLYSLLLIAAAGGLIALAWNQDRKLDLNISDFNLQAFVNSTDSWKWIATIILAAIALLGLFTLIVAVTRDGVSASRGALRMKQTDGGTVEVTASAIENLLRDELLRLPEVRDIDPKVRLAGGAIDTYLDAVIEPSASIAHVTTVLGQGVATVLRDQVGVTNIRRPNIKIRYDEVNARPVRSESRPRPQMAGRTAAPSQAEPPIPPPPAARQSPQDVGNTGGEHAHD